MLTSSIKNGSTKCPESDFLFSLVMPWHTKDYMISGDGSKDDISIYMRKYIIFLKACV